MTSKADSDRVLRQSKFPDKHLNVFKPLPSHPMPISKSLNRQKNMYSNPAARSEPELSAVDECIVSPRAYSSVSFLEEYFAMVQELSEPSSTEAQPSIRIVKDEDRMTTSPTTVAEHQPRRSRPASQDSFDSMDDITVPLDQNGLLIWAPLTPPSVSRTASATTGRKPAPPSLNLTTSSSDLSRSVLSRKSSRSDYDTPITERVTSPTILHWTDDPCHKSSKRKSSAISPNIPDTTDGVTETGGRFRRFNPFKVQQSLRQPSSKNSNSNLAGSILPSEIRSSAGPDTPYPNAVPHSPLSRRFAKVAGPFYQGTSHVKQALMRAKSNVTMSTAEKRREELKKSIVLINHSPSSSAGSINWI